VVCNVVRSRFRRLRRIGTSEEEREERVAIRRTKAQWLLANPALEDFGQSLTVERFDAIQVDSPYMLRLVREPLNKSEDSQQ
jgi:hypothetical protein